MGAYCAANQFLDTFAAWRSAEGKPTLSINWGIWDQLGHVPEATRNAYELAGLIPMESSAALDAMGRLISASTANATVARIDWNRLRAVYEARGRKPILSELEDPIQTSHKPKYLPAAGGEEKPASAGNLSLGVTSAIVTEEAAAVLALRIDEIDPDRGLFEMGMDSLMSVELKTRLERRFSRKLPSTLAFNYPTVSALARFLSEPLSPAVMPPAIPASILAAPPAEIDSADLSEDDLADLLTKSLEQLD
jgi:acyl carrier protein